MKQIVIGAVFSIMAFSCTHVRPDIVTETISPEKLKKDFAVLKEILQQVHAGAFAYADEHSFYHCFDSIAASVNTALTRREFYDKVDLIIDNIHCAHTDCFFPDEYIDTISKRKYFFPVPLIKIGQRIYINTENYNIPNGSELFAINNNTVKELFGKLLYHAHADGPGNKIYQDEAINSDFAFDYYVAYGPSDNFEIKYRDAETHEVDYMQVPARSLNEISTILDDDTYYSFPTDFSYDLKVREEKKAAVLIIRSFNQETYSKMHAFHDFLQNSFSLLQLKGIKNLVIDFRNNRGGYFKNSYKLLSYFISSPLLQFDSVIKRFNHLPLKEYVTPLDSSMEVEVDTSYTKYRPVANHRYSLNKQQIDTCFPARHLFNGKLFIITNSCVISAAASAVALLKERAGATVVGEETGGGYAAFNSDVLSYTLPNTGIKLNIPTVRYYPPVVKKQLSGGVSPDYYRPITKPDFTDMNDGPLHFILDSLIR